MSGTTMARLGLLACAAVCAATAAASESESDANTNAGGVTRALPPRWPTATGSANDESESSDRRRFDAILEGALRIQGQEAMLKAPSRGVGGEKIDQRRLKIEEHLSDVMITHKKTLRGLAEGDEEAAAAVEAHDDEEGGDHDDEEGAEEHYEGDGHDHGDEDHDSHEDGVETLTDSHEGEDEDHDSHDDEHDSHDDEHDSHDDHDSHDESASTLESRSAEQQEGKPWKEVILSTFIINVLALVGIIILAPGVGRARVFCLAVLGRNKNRSQPEDSPDQEDQQPSGGGTKESSKLVDIAIPSFAAGALLAAAVFLIIPEAIRFIEQGVVAATEFDPHAGEGGGDDSHDGHDGHRFLQDEEEVDPHAGHSDEVKTGAEWRFGAALLGGFLLPMVLGALFPRSSEHVCDDECGESPDLRNTAAAVALIPPASPDAGAGGVAAKGDEHCCHCEVEAMEDGVRKNITVHVPKKNADEEEATAGVDGATVASNCPTCDDLDKSASGIKQEAEGGCCESKECSSPSSPAHDHHSDHAGSHKNCSDDSSDEDTFDDEIKHRSSMSLKSSIANVCRHGAPLGQQHKVRNDINYRLCASILIGDGFHNYADGIFIGIAFMLCSRDVAISIMVVTLYHEVAQELADFFLLTRHAGLGVWSALLLNFCSGLSVMLGGITILAVELTAQAIGVILAIAAGVYIHIGASECIPRVDAASKDWKDRVLSFLMFMVGAVPIGLALLNHQHCEG